jgi:hypothetical protein
MIQDVVIVGARGRNALGTAGKIVASSRLHSVGTSG